MNDQKHTEVKFNKDAVDAIYEGVKEVTEATVTTLGPMGRNALIDLGYAIDIIHDGVRTAESINPTDPFKRAGARVVQEAAKKQRDAVGDGTTAVMCLTQAILDQTLQATASGINPMSLRRGLESGSKKIVAALTDMATPVNTLRQKTQVATISAEDEELGKLVAKTIEDIGDDGVLTVDTSKAMETFVEMQEGMQIDKGYAHQFMVTDPERLTAVLEDCHILVTDHPLTTIAEIAKFLNNVVFPNTKKVLFISPEVGIDFMQVLLGAKQSGQFLGVAMRAPGIGSGMTDQLQDICALTGATLIAKDRAMKFDDLSFDVLGRASRVTMSKISTIITGGSGHRKDVLQRIASIKTQMEDDTISEWEREQLKARHARLTNGVAVIKVGGETEIEVKERKERVIDAVAATQAAVKQGIVPGGETAYLNALTVLDDAVLGEKILKEALKEPFKRLVSNAGYDAGEKLAQLTQTNKNKQVGFDVLDGQFKDMMTAGIVDPLLVPVTAVKTAVSVAVQLSSLGAAIVQLEPQK
mgnify:CR=1 FL=1